MGLAPSTVEAVRQFLQSPAAVPRKISDLEEGQLMAMISSVKNPPDGSFQVTKWEVSTDLEGLRGPLVVRCSSSWAPSI